VDLDRSAYANRLLYKGNAGAVLGHAFASFPPGLSGGSRGIINAFGNLGGFLGPSLMGWLASRTGDLKFGILGLSLLLGLSAAFTALLPRVTSRLPFQVIPQKSPGFREIKL
jgi:nitrate/nitrite transporter NarK